MHYKTSTQLFHGTYQYKVVLVCAGASIFRNKDLDNAIATLENIDLSNIKTNTFSRYNHSIKTQEDLDYARSLHKCLIKLEDFNLRVEVPYVSVYTNNKKDVDSLIKLDTNRVKYVCVPPKNTTLESGVIILPKVPFDYKVTLGKTIQDHSSFISWAEANSKVKLTKSCAKELSKTRSWGGTYFYISGENNLLLAKMHLGRSINKIERIVKA